MSDPLERAKKLETAAELASKAPRMLAQAKKMMAAAKATTQAAKILEEARKLDAAVQTAKLATNVLTQFDDPAWQKTAIDYFEKTKTPNSLDLALEALEAREARAKLLHSVYPLDPTVMSRMAELATTSDKIRALAAASIPRAEIAKALGIRYQHVRNVLVADEAKAETVFQTPGQETAQPRGGLMRGKLGPAGRVVVPAQVREALGLEEGAELVFTLDGDEVRIATMKTHLKRLQARVREMIPEGVSLVDELIAERRAEQAAEDAK